MLLQLLPTSSPLPPCLFFSLVSLTADKLHASMEMNNWTILQIQSKANPRLKVDGHQSCCENMFNFLNFKKKKWKCSPKMPTDRTPLLSIHRQASKSCVWTSLLNSISNSNWIYRFNFIFCWCFLTIYVFKNRNPHPQSTSIETGMTEFNWFHLQMFLLSVFGVAAWFRPQWDAMNIDKLPRGRQRQNVSVKRMSTPSRLLPFNSNKQKNLKSKNKKGKKQQNQPFPQPLPQSWFFRFEWHIFVNFFLYLWY